MKEVRFYIDPQTGQPHIYEHGVCEDEIEEVMRNRPITQLGRRSPKGELSSIAFGQTGAGRFLKVLYARTYDSLGIHIITSYDLRAKELLVHGRRLRRRNR